MAANEAKLRGPYYRGFEPSSSPKRRRWKFEYWRRVYARFRAFLRPIWGYSLACFEEGRKWFKSPQRIKKRLDVDRRHAQLSSASAVVFASLEWAGSWTSRLRRFSFCGWVVKWRQLLHNLRTLLFANPSFWSINSNRTLGFVLMLFEENTQFKTPTEVTGKPVIQHSGVA